MSMADAWRIHGRNLKLSLKATSGRGFQFDLSDWNIASSMTQDGATQLAKKFIEKWNRDNPDRTIEGNDYSEVLDFLSRDFLRTAEAQASHEMKQGTNVND